MKSNRMRFLKFPCMHLILLLVLGSLSSFIECTQCAARVQVYNEYRTTLISYSTALSIG